MKNKHTALVAIFVAATVSVASAAQISSQIGAMPKKSQGQAALVCECGAKIDASKQHSHRISVGMQVKGLKTSDKNFAKSISTAEYGKDLDSVSNGGSSFPKVGYFK